PSPPRSPPLHVRLSPAGCRRVPEPGMGGCPFSAMSSGHTSVWSGEVGSSVAPRAGGFLRVEADRVRRPALDLLNQGGGKQRLPVCLFLLRSTGDATHWHLLAVLDRVMFAQHVVGNANAA